MMEWVTVIVAVVSVLVAAGSFLITRRAGRKREIEATRELETVKSQYGELLAQRDEAREKIEALRFDLEQSGGVGKDTAVRFDLPSVVPEVPAELVEACASGLCVLMAGSGVSAQASLPTWREILLHLIDRAEADDESGNWSELVDALRVGRLSDVESLIGSRLPRERLVSMARELYARPMETLPPVCRDLSEIPFAGVITPNWDQLLERTFEGENPLVVLSSNSEVVERLVAGDRFFVVKLYGDPNWPETFRFTPDEYVYDLFENKTYSKFLTSQFLSRSVFFVGTSLKGLEDFLSGLKLRDTPTKPHFALVPLQSDWALQEELFRAKYGVRLLGYQPTRGFPEFPAFIKKLQELVAERDRAVGRAEIRPATLSHVALRNIGVFEDLELELTKGWNVLLGNNGKGKSTLLKAIALGLCGDDEKAADAGERLLRSGASSGSIRLRVGEDEYLTELFRESDGVRVRCSQLTPLQKGNWVVLGFPAMRGVATRNPAGPAGKSVHKPVVQDLLPLIRGAVDHRMDDLKQWIVNVDARASGGDGADPADARRCAQLRTAFFKLLKKVSPSRLEVEFDHIDKSTWDVIVRADGLPVSIDQVSQGMSSIYGWVGTLLQRMYEIYVDDDNPEQKSALILVDEIDAHLHPEWQQLLVRLIKEEFPDLQLIATTHSPLLVAGMKSKEVWIAKREAESEKVVVVPAPVEFEGMRADQILTSPAFGLTTTRDLDTRDEIKRYGELRGRKVELERKESLSASEQDELREINAVLPQLEKSMDSILSIGETAAERRVEQAVRRAINEVPLSESAPESPLEPAFTQEVELEIKKRLAEIFNTSR